RVFGSLPNQPARRGRFVLVACRSCTNAPATAPGLALRYLYEHHTAKSTFQSCNARGTLPIAWARSKPTMIPQFWAAAVISGMMSIDSELCPIVHFLFDDCTSTFRHQAERIAGEINPRPAVLPERQMKFFAKLPEWILGIEPQRKILVAGKLHSTS